MAGSEIPASYAWDGNARAWFVPKGQDPLSVAVLEAVTTKDITYALKTFTPSISEDTIDDPRWTLKQKLQRAGKFTESYTVNYIFGGEDAIAYDVLKDGVEGSIVIRYSEANETDPAVGQIVDVLSIQCGRQIKDAAVENGIQTVTQTLRTIALTQSDVALVA